LKTGLRAAKQSLTTNVFLVQFSSVLLAGPDSSDRNEILRWIGGKMIGEPAAAMDLTQILEALGFDNLCIHSQSCQIFLGTTNQNGKNVPNF
jgi:hypothetical protein